MRRNGNVVAWLPVVHDDLAAQHVEYVPRVVKRKSTMQRVGIALAIGVAATFALYALAFLLANPDSFELSRSERADRRVWLRAVTFAGAAVAFVVAGWSQWPRRRRDRDGVPMAVPTKETLQQLRHRRQAA